jgi:phosphoribosylamine-glycine ligase
LRRTAEEALAAVDMMFEGGMFGAAGASVVIEEFSTGEEASFFALCDGEHALASPPRRTTSASATATPARTPAAWAPIRRPR